MKRWIAIYRGPSKVRAQEVTDRLNGAGIKATLATSLKAGNFESRIATRKLPDARLLLAAENPPQEHHA